MMRIDKLINVVMVLLVFTAFCVMPAAAITIDERSHSSDIPIQIDDICALLIGSIDNQSTQSEVKEKIQKLHESFNGTEYKKVVSHVAGSMNYVTTESLYFSQDGKVQVTTSNEVHDIGPNEGGARSAYTIYKDGVKIIDGAFDAFGKADAVVSLASFEIKMYNENGGEEKRATIDKISMQLLFDTNKKCWKLVRHKHLTSGQVDAMLDLSDTCITCVLWVAFSVFGFGVSGIFSFLAGEAVSILLHKIVNNKRNEDGSLDTWGTIHIFRKHKDETKPPDLETEKWYGSKGFKKSTWYENYVNEKKKKEDWMGYDVFYGDSFKSTGNAKYVGKGPSVNLPVYIKPGPMKDE